MAKLTDKVGNNESHGLLTNKRDVPFVLGLGLPIEKGYSFAELEKSDNKNFQRFLDKITKMTVQQVDSSFARKPDKDDVYKGRRVYHYAVTDSFRVHVVNIDGIYHVLRIDPNHKVNR